MGLSYSEKEVLRIVWNTYLELALRLELSVFRLQVGCITSYAKLANNFLILFLPHNLVSNKYSQIDYFL